MSQHVSLISAVAEKIVNLVNPVATFFAGFCVSPTIIIIIIVPYPANAS